MVQNKIISSVNIIIIPLTACLGISLTAPQRCPSHCWREYDLCRHLPNITPVLQTQCLKLRMYCIETCHLKARLRASSVKNELPMNKGIRKHVKLHHVSVRCLNNCWGEYDACLTLPDITQIFHIQCMKIREYCTKRCYLRARLRSYHTNSSEK